MLSLLTATVAVMAVERQQPLLGDLGTHSARVDQELLEDLARLEGSETLAQQLTQFGDRVKDEGSGHDGMMKALEKDLVVEVLYDRECFDFAFFWQRVMPIRNTISGIVLGQSAIGILHSMAHHGDLCTRTFGLIF